MFHLNMLILKVPKAILQRKRIVLYVEETDFEIVAESNLKHYQ